MARTPRQIEDERLALRCRLGEPGAFAELVETMERALIKKLRREKRFTIVMWIYIVALTTILLTGSGLLIIHKIEGTWMAVSAVFWFLFGAVFLLSHLINQRNFELVKEIKGVELRLASLEEHLAGRVDVASTPPTSEISV